jgi:hypothetical protein
MRSRVLVGTLLLGGVLAFGTFARAGAAAIPSRQWTVVNFDRPTLIAGAVAMGPVLIVHDEAKMARGEPCTVIYKFDKAKGLQKAIVSFACKPVQRSAVDKFTSTCVWTSIHDVYKLTEYQFPGDSEGHGVPDSSR